MTPDILLVVKTMAAALERIENMSKIIEKKIDDGDKNFSEVHNLILVVCLKEIASVASAVGILATRKYE